MTPSPSGLEPETFELEVQCANPLRHGDCLFNEGATIRYIRYFLLFELYRENFSCIWHLYTFLSSYKMEEFHYYIEIYFDASYRIFKP